MLQEPLKHSSPHAASRPKSQPVVASSDAGEYTVADRKLAVASETIAVVAETGPAVKT